jgi:ABC-type branched-subunit amino acid transport system ATPase component
MYSSKVKLPFLKSETLDAILSAAAIITKSERRKLIVVVFIQMFLGLLDLVAVGIVGIVGALAISGISSTKPGNKVAGVLNCLGIENLSLQQQVALLGFIAAVLMVSKTLVSVLLVRRVTFFLARRGAEISGRLVARLLNQSLTELSKKSHQQVLYSITAGVDAVTVGILNTAINLVADIFLILLIGVGLFTVDWTVAIISILIFTSAALTLYKLLEVRSKQIGIELANLTIASNQKILEVLNSYREIVVRDRRGYYAAEITNVRRNMADISAEKSFMPSITKYVFEVTMILAAIVIAGSQFLLNTAIHAAGVLAVFLAAASRISPAILRVQQSFLVLKSSTGAATETIQLIQELEFVEPVHESESPNRFKESHTAPRLSISNVTYFYPGNKSPAIDGVSIEVSSGESLAIVGPSGAGKSTLADLLLGLAHPQHGKIEIAGYSPEQIIRSQPGLIAYVPQDVVITAGTIRENIALGYNPVDFNDEYFNEPLRAAQLFDFVKSLPNGLDTDLGERGSRLSGGQRQRLGIARALFTNPALIVLDEATSALDGETEANLSQAISSLKGAATVIVIAHRLASIKEATQVAYFEEGRLICVGTFDHVRELVPNFEKQANLMKLE